MIDDARGESAVVVDMSPASSAAPAGSASLTSTQLAWLRSDLANLRTLLAWARTTVSMIGFGFTIYNFYRGFLVDIAGPRGTEAARNLGVALVAAGTLAMVVALWNYWSINASLVALDATVHVPDAFKRRWIYSYVMSGVLILIGFVTLLFMLRII